MEILKLEKDMRRNSDNKEVVIMCPCGDAKQFHSFQQMMVDQKKLEQIQGEDYHASAVRLLQEL